VKWVIEGTSLEELYDLVVALRNYEFKDLDKWMQGN